jgi:hypothetical protein
MAKGTAFGLPIDFDVSADIDQKWVEGDETKGDITIDKLKVLVELNGETAASSAIVFHVRMFEELSE